LPPCLRAWAHSADCCTDMASLAEVQERSAKPAEGPDERLEGEALDRYVDRHGAAHLLLRHPEGKPSVRQSSFVRRDDVFWFPPTMARELVRAEPRVIVAFMDETSEAIVAVVIEGDACLVHDGVRQGWLRVDAARVFSFVVCDVSGQSRRDLSSRA
jgi:hypothetical protein